MESKKLCHLNKIADVNNNKGIKLLHKAAAPGSHCPMHTTLATVKRIGGISTLVVGMPECGYYSRYVMDYPYGSSGELHYVYEMDSNEVVFGCREGLMEAIKEMDREGAKIILLVATCIPELIGEDIEAVITELQGSVKTKLLYTNAAHFKRNGYQAGYFNTVAKLVEAVDPMEIKEERERVNLLGAANSKEMVIFKDLLIEKGYEINVLDFNLSIKEIEKAIQAKVSIVLSPKLNKLAKTLKEKYHIPYLCLHNIYSSQDLEHAYDRLMDILNIEDFNDLDSLKEQLRNLEKQCVEVLKHKVYIATNAELDVIPFASYLSCFKMTPLLLHVEEFYEENKEFSDKIVEYGVNPYVCYVSDNNKVVDIIEEHKVDLCFGDCKAMLGEKLITSKELMRMMQLSGYERSIFLLKSLLSLLNIEGEGCENNGVI
jgi:nitrogenase molybdenum-iron protein alpha/beta subunit